QRGDMRSTANDQGAGKPAANLVQQASLDWPLAREHGGEPDDVAVGRNAVDDLAELQSLADVTRASVDIPVLVQTGADGVDDGDVVSVVPEVPGDVSETDARSSFVVGRTDRRHHGPAHERNMRPNDTRLVVVAHQRLNFPVEITGLTYFV